MINFGFGRNGRNEVNSYISVDKHRSIAHIIHKITFLSLGQHV